MPKKVNIDLDKLKNLWETTSLSYVEIAKEMNSSFDTVRRRIMSNGWVRPQELIDAEKSNRFKKILETKIDKGLADAHIENEEEKVRDLYYNTNLSKTEIANKLGIKVSRIKTYIESFDTVRSDEHIKKVKQKVNKEMFREGYNFERKEIQDKVKQNKLEVYGNENPFVTDKFKEQASRTKIERYKDVNYNNRDLAAKTCLERYGVTNYLLSDLYAPNHNARSKLNASWKEKLEKVLGIEVKDEVSIVKFRYDLCIGNLLIDINPTISHNSTISYPYKLGILQENNPVKPDYHYNRTMNALENGYELISIFDWMEEDKVIDIIKARLKKLNNRIFGNKCVVKEISQKDANIFLNNYHLQGGTNGQDVCVGLFYNEELVQVQTFGKPRFNKDAEWEAIRLVSKSDTYIIGGVSKGFKYFVDKYKPNSIISYNSLNISSGHTDDMQGFKLLGYSKSQGIWVNTINNSNPFMIRDASLRKQGIHRLLNRPAEDFPDYDGTFETSNEFLIIQEGYVKVYDCGNVTYLWKKE